MDSLNKMILDKNLEVYRTIEKYDYTKRMLWPELKSHYTSRGMKD
jgi:hypothetical protein